MIVQVSRIFAVTCLAVSLVAVPVFGQGIDLARLPYSEIYNSGPQPEFAGTLDALATALGLPSLHRAGLPDPFRELRVWFGFGLIGPSGFVRIVSDGERVAGEMYHWGNRVDIPPPEMAGHRESRRRRHGCFEEESLQSPEFDLCRVRFDSAYDWGAVLDTLVIHRVWELPDQEEGVIGTDGWSLVVEARDGAVYHTYEYWVPEASRGPAEQDAEAILRYSWGLSAVSAQAARRMQDIRDEPGWCTEETPYSKGVAEVTLRYLRQNRRSYREPAFDAANWRPVDGATCRLLREVGFGGSEEYLTLAYVVESGFLVFEIGRRRTVAEGCGEVRYFTRDLDSVSGWTTFCFSGSEGGPELDSEPEHE